MPRKWTSTSRRPMLCMNARDTLGEPCKNICTTRLLRYYNSPALGYGWHYVGAYCDEHVGKAKERLLASNQRVFLHQLTTEPINKNRKHE